MITPVSFVQMRVWLYENICLCSVDTLKKLRLVEERGCEFSLLAIVKDDITGNRHAYFIVLSV